MLVALKQEILSLSLKEKLFIFSAMLCGFLISVDYAIIRPVSNSVFITAYSTSYFPYAWLATVPLNLFIVALYNKYLPRWGNFRTYLSIAALVIVCNLSCAFFLKGTSWLPFLLYIWKEVYILLMFQQLWSVIHVTIPFHRAKYLYGILFGTGALGSVSGSILPGFFAVKVGSESLLLSTPITYTLLTIAFWALLHFSGQAGGRDPTEEKKHSSWEALKQGIDLIRRSPFLPYILAIVTLMQVSSSLVDFQFNHHLEQAVSTKDLRTEYTARVLGIVSLSTLTLQFVGSFLLVHFLGFKRSHFLVPFLLCINGAGFILFPTFAMISFSYITIKCFDFSFFGVIKEMLYVPLKKEEKFRAKSLIDVFAYRTSKAISSLLILGLQFWVGIQAHSILSWAAVAILVLWCYTVVQMFKTYDLVLQPKNLSQ
jgi:AAA family ATP:ADP antiporter